MNAFIGAILLSLTVFSSFTLRTTDTEEIKSIETFSDDRDGSSFEKAIIITDTTSGAGIAAEYRYLRTYYPGYKLKRQMLSFNNDIPYDVLQIKYKGKVQSVYFDISHFFGKW